MIALARPAATASRTSGQVRFSTYQFDGTEGACVVGSPWAKAAGGRTEAKASTSAIRVMGPHGGGAAPRPNSLASAAGDKTCGSELYVPLKRTRPPAASVG